MTRAQRILRALGAALAIVAAPPAAAQEGAGPAAAPGSALDALFEELRQPDLEHWQRVETRIWREWSRSGSAAMDLLLQRGRDALQAGETAAAIEHLTALVDHAPDFAEGWNARATAFYMAGHYGPALDDIRTALALEPRHFGALSGLGLILEEMGRLETALEAYRASLAIHPHLQAARDGVARIERRLGGQAL